MEEIQIQSNDGRSIPTTIHEGGKEAPVVIICHGFQRTQQSDMAKTLRLHLEKKGLNVVTFDFNGHGKSEEPFAEFSTTRALEDLHAVIAHVKERFPGQTIGLAGNSTGGTVACLAAAEDPEIKALVLHAPMIDLDEAIEVKARKAKFKKEQLLRVWKQYGFLEYNNSHGQRDRLNYGYYDDKKNDEILEAAGKIQAPVMLVHGRKDETIPFSQGQKLKTILEKRAQAPFLFRTAARGKHEFVGPNLRGYARAAARFLQKHLVT